ncbi:MAG: mobile mystery protein A [Nocardioidaceae bacterium]|nr:mobile mystery protein A [Nocardioidaceae bacterium]
MADVRTRVRARATLEDRFTAWRDLPARGARPHGGWVRAVREALGMTAADLADRMGVSQPSVTRLEKSERDDAARLETLIRAADALGCDLVYALVPRRPLDDMVTEQARRRALRRVEQVGHTMALEDQAVDDRSLAEKIEALTEFYRTHSGLWRTDDDAV